MEFGHVDTILGCLKNADEGVILNVCMAIEVLLTPTRERTTEALDNLVDLMVRHGAIALLNSHIRVDGNLDIKKAALKVLIKMLSTESRSLKELI